MDYGDNGGGAGGDEAPVGNSNNCKYACDVILERSGL